MPIFLLDVSLAAFCCCIGVVGGWWLRSRGAKRTINPDTLVEQELAQNVLARVQEVAQRVAENMGQHSTRVRDR